MTIPLTAQQRKVFFLKGYVRDSTDLIVNAHVVNISKERGTFTNDYGLYKIQVSLGDTIEVSSVQHEPFRAVITEQIAFSQELKVVLNKRRIELGIGDGRIFTRSIGDSGDPTYQWASETF